MRCWVKSRNERNPYPLLPARNGGNSKETAGDKPEEGGDDVKVIMALTARATHVLQWRVQRAANSREGESQKARRSPDRSLQLDSMKSESLVIANQNVAVNTFPGLVHTARHTMGEGCTRSSR